MKTHLVTSTTTLVVAAAAAAAAVAAGVTSSAEAAAAGTSASHQRRRSWLAAATAATASAASAAPVPSPSPARVHVIRGGDDTPKHSHHNQNDDTTDTNKSTNTPNKKKLSSYRKKKKKKKFSTTKKKLAKDATGRSDEEDATQESMNKTQQQQQPRINPLVEDIVQQDEYYAILGLDPSLKATISARVIQKAYRKRCVHTHPDKTDGDRRAFDKVAEAYNVLNDSTQRQLYNQYGRRGLEDEPGGMESSPGGMFQTMFQQAAAAAAAQRQRQQQHYRRNPTLRYQLQVKLEDLYHGVTQTVQVSAPRSAQHQHRSSTKQVDVLIPKGAQNGAAVVLSGEVDTDSGPPGDLIFVLTQLPHPTFTRKGQDLAMEVTITLEEAVCGMHRSIPHLDGTELWLESASFTIQHETPEGEIENTPSSSKEASSSSRTIPVVIKTGDVQVLKGRGMPKSRQPHRGAEDDDFGDLYIQYRVEMPTARTTAAAARTSSSKKKNAKKNNETSRNSKSDSGELTEQEYHELSRLLSKLDGGGPEDRRTTTTRRRRQNTNKTVQNNDDNEQEELKTISPTIHVLQEATAADFGRASGRPGVNDDDHRDEDFHPFASARGTGGGAFHPFGASSSSSQFYFGRNSASSSSSPHPFFGGGGGDSNHHNPDDDDDGNVQCQQM